MLEQQEEAHQLCRIWFGLLKICDKTYCILLQGVTQAAATQLSAQAAQV